METNASLQEFSKLYVNAIIDRALETVRAEGDGFVDGMVSRAITRGMEGIDDNSGVDDLVWLTLRNSVTAIRDGQRSPTENVMQKVLKDMKYGSDVYTSEEHDLPFTQPGLGTTLTSDTSAEEVNFIEIHKPDEGSGIKADVHIAAVKMEADVHDASRGLTTTDKPTVMERVTTDDVGRPIKKNIIRRVLDSIVQKQKKRSRTISASVDEPSGRKKTFASKAHNRRDWILRNILCCFKRQSATVEPM